MTIRKAVMSDAPEILALIHQLAEYEKAPEQVVATEEDIKRSFFGENPQVFCHVATDNDHVVGIAIWFLNYSTWLGKHGIYLEDLFVIPEARGEGHGIALLKELAKICVENDYERFQWWVLDWNLPSIKFYESLGAVGMDEWTVFRMTGESIKRLASD
ncbi:MAG: GNAT family N-acetyltransferase [Candidatus Nanopelagicaceae bacterium]|nr:GNAT family N-acetyltransferase [Candidatus Nanopelagicaceae bacterium]